MITKKNMVLCGVNDESKKAVLSLEFDGQNLNGRLRLYNFESEPSGILSLGLTNKDGVVKAGLTKTSNMLFSFSSQVTNLPQDFSCAIINFVGGEPNPILFGSSQGLTDLEKTLAEVVKSIKTSSNIKEVEQVLDEFELDYDQELKQEVEEEIDKNFKQENFSVCENKNCNECMYKKYFYEHNQTQTFSNLKQEVEEKHEEIKEDFPTFYGEIKHQIETLFSENKPEEYLESAIPNSKWVKVDFDDGGDYYVFGLIYEEDELKYVCYGIPSIYSVNPPKQLSGYPVWFPLDKEKREGFGYWLSYQDASTGESIKAIVE